jgi:hypothetical protein
MEQYNYLQLDTQDKIELLMNNFKEFLKEKNRRYGNSALQPVNIFSSVQSGDQIKNRLDDKLSRIKQTTEQNVALRKNDVADIFGYVALLMISNDWLEFDDLLD